MRHFEYLVCGQNGPRRYERRPRTALSENTELFIFKHRKIFGRNADRSFDQRHESGNEHHHDDFDAGLEDADYFDWFICHGNRDAATLLVGSDIAASDRFIGAFFVFPSLDKLFSKYQVWFDECNTVARESMQGVRVVKSFNRQDQETEKFTASSNKLNQLNIKIGYVFSILMPAFTLVVCIGTALIVYLVGKNIGLYPKDISAISSYVGYLSQMLSNLAFGGMMLAQYSRGLVSLKRIDEVIETEHDLKFNHEESNVDLKGSVEFDDVSFKYPGSSKETLSHVSFKVAPGETVGIVGRTGSGKSTLVSLMVRLYDPTSGTVRLGGCDLRDVNERKLRKMAALVQQKALLFSGTIADNLRQGDENATEEDMERAIEISRAKEFIDKYPDRFEHVVEERSANFSGGQQQRLSIARGIIGKPKVLILDDSTSALDAESEKKVQAGLEQKLGDATVFIIAEKIFSVMHADKILVMDDGKIKAMGTHEELLLTSPLYRGNL